MLNLFRKLLTMHQSMARIAHCHKNWLLSFTKTSTASQQKLVPGPRAVRSQDLGLLGPIDGLNHEYKFWQVYSRSNKGSVQVNGGESLHG